MMLHGPIGLPTDPTFILEDDDGEAIDLRTGGEAKRIPDGEYAGFIMRDCWFTFEKEPKP